MLHLPLAGGMQDYNYVRASCYELTLQLSCCMYPSPAQLPAFWEANRDALITFLLQVHMGESGAIAVSHSSVTQSSATGLSHTSVAQSSHCGFAWSDMVHGCMVYTELAPRRQQFHVAPAMPAL